MSKSASLERKSDATRLRRSPDVTADLNRRFARTPYAVSFPSQGHTFTLVTLHVLYGEEPADRVPELRATAKWLAGWAEREFGWDHNLIALGDFNIDCAGDPLFAAFTATGLVPAPQLAVLPRTTFDDPGAEHFYDQIAWFTEGQAESEPSCPGACPTPTRSGSNSRTSHTDPRAARAASRNR
ncbi:hypothetical protein FE633_20660 [Streptomyces montanus]|uniref:Endonuclease/exonuclease/phosphatase domain-containing protein n=1 Tax=Streptomyces montanus TaxID=2580423 RepID=A0A5R9FSR5_9ACTN|nr:hypothetical protein [Streptomyces montanus]TLS44418.1 hypothetical protein FE633_20660 [Streptomyces montanus]